MGYKSHCQIKMEEREQNKWILTLWILRPASNIGGKCIWAHVARRTSAWLGLLGRAGVVECKRREMRRQFTGHVEAGRWWRIPGRYDRGFLIRRNLQLLLLHNSIVMKYFEPWYNIFYVLIFLTMSHRHYNAFLHLLSNPLWWENRNISAL